jgi:iron complex outermembrane recepter protein
VITRPSIDSLKAYSYINLRDFKYYASNPGLEPLRANQLDTSLEWYFSEYGALTAAFYYKDIKSFIEYGDNGTETIDGQQFKVESSKNGEFGGTIKGIELAYQQSFSEYLPSPFDGLGVQLNYTYVDSEYDDPDRQELGLPFEGMPKNSYNAVIYYEKAAIQARLAYNWRGKVMTYADDWGGPRWDAAYGQYDFSSSYDVSDKMSLTLSVNNLTNERNWGYIARPEQVAHLARYGRLINFGVSMSF